MRGGRLLLASVLSVLMVCFCSTGVLAQSASITGTATDTSKAVIPGVSITAENTQTGVVTTTVTNEAGVYTFPTLQTGIYRLKAELPGFQTKNYTNFPLEVGAQLRMNFELTVAAVSNSVDVNAAADMPLAQASSTIGGVLTVQ